ncbi:MAG: zinc ribbon domain-containing protein [Acidobacteriota bacterium]
MQKAATDNVVCIACGADVRSEALFCYNCGGAVVVQPKPAVDTKSADAVVEAEPEQMVASATPEKIVPPTETGTAVTNGSTAKPESKPLSAAMLRRKRAYNRQPVEVVWEEPRKPSVTFVITSIVFTLIAALLLAAALYLK